MTSFVHIISSNLFFFFLQLLIISSWSLSEIFDGQLITKDTIHVPISNQSAITHSRRLLTHYTGHTSRRLLQSSILFDSTSDPIPASDNARLSLFVNANQYTELAADFTVSTPSDCGWNISAVSVHGVYIPNGIYLGIATWTVRIYEDDVVSGDGPGALLTERIVSNFNEQFGIHAATDVAVTLSISPSINVPQGHYWISVQINTVLAYVWFWFLTTTQRDQEYYQRETNLGLGGCDSDWGRGSNDCNGPVNALDLLFSIEGEIRPCTDNPTSDPTREPTRSPTPSPTSDPTPITPSPTLFPTSDPTREPTRSPTLFPTSDPTPDPTRSPTPSPTSFPTSDPTREPTRSPTTNPTSAPSTSPTTSPSSSPTLFPTSDPTSDPTFFPTSDPTRKPTQSPISVSFPTQEPTQTASSPPSVNPTTFPTLEPTFIPTMNPTLNPTDFSSSIIPTLEPTHVPTSYPSIQPTVLSTMPTKRQTGWNQYHASTPQQKYQSASSSFDADLV
eukprot:885424_1